MTIFQLAEEFYTTQIVIKRLIREHNLKPTYDGQDGRKWPRNTFANLRRDHDMTSSELAWELRVDLRTINRWLKSGRLVPSYRTSGGRARWSVADVKEIKRCRDKKELANPLD